MRIIDVYINFDKENNTEYTFKQLDTTLVRCFFNGNINLNGKIIQVYWKTPNGAIIQQDANTLDTEHKIAYFNLLDDCVSEYGKVEFEIRVIENGSVISTYKATGSIAKSVIGDINENSATTYLEEIENNIVALEQELANCARTIDLPTRLADLSDDNMHRVVTDIEKTIWNSKSDFSGSYNDLRDQPTIPTEVTEVTVANWGFTKNTGTYSKPSGGIPKTDLDSSVQASLDKADTALQTHQDISGKQDVLVAGTNISIAADGKTISATDTTYNDATTSTAGLMSATDKTKLNGIASGAEVNVQSNWNETNTSSDAYIQNKPTIPTVNDSIITIQMNGSTVDSFTTNASSAKTINLGTVITSHQDISGKLDTSKVKNATSTTAGDVYDVRYINTMLGDIETILTTLTTGSGV